MEEHERLEVGHRARSRNSRRSSGSRYAPRQTVVVVRERSSTPAHLRAHVRRLEPHRDALRVDELDERVGDLLAEALLHGEAAGEEADEAGQLGDADDSLAGDVADVGVAGERERVVLAERGERDRPFDDLRERLLSRRRRSRSGTSSRAWVALVPGGRVVERTQEPLGCLLVPGVSGGSPNAVRISPTSPR